MITACAWCRRETTRDSEPIGKPLDKNGGRYRRASHGLCLECADAFENGKPVEAVRVQLQS